MAISARDKAEQLLRQAEAGELLQEKRAEKGCSLAQVGEIVGCSPTYLSEIERGLKLPSDILISKLARFYEMDETELFHKYRKIPLPAIEELEKNTALQKTLLEINKNKNLTEEQKHKLYDKLYDIYKDFVNKGGGGQEEGGS
ncbi:Helix-turn-helix [Desulfotomaculum arcticum]|uniref:Helix-turn-helix n=1 Tax=Desulfotruncus arcticus DSM 17038 TaxID=1121424 RepID=A0A1I2YA74_9FIRM|nr:helix-turn-helix transcriptional regulator [Desulfotruncus arcticus]SFH22668.1 Helix-turn-helix [Desulfotomaculum arcticum] [Desulfotruncus arcticus DSM 17038]